MARRYFNWKLAIVLLVGITVLGVTAYALRQWQKETRAERGLELGNQAYEEKRYEEAAGHLGRYVGVYKDNIPAMLRYADAHMNIRPLKRNNIQQAIGTYNIILRRDPSNSEAARRLVGLHLSMEAFGEAERVAKEFLDKTDDVEIRRMHATALANQKKFPDAIAEFRSVIADEPNQIVVYGYLGQMAEQVPAEFKQNETPIFWYDEAVNKNPDSALAYISRAAYYRKIAEKDKALAQLEKAESLELSEKNVRIILAGEYLNAGVLEKAEEHLKAAKEEEPENMALWGMWSQLAVKSNSRKKAIEVAEDGLESLTARPWDFMPRAAELFIMAGESQRATECIEKLDQKDIDPRMVARLRAMLAEQQGDLRAAAKYWQQSVSLGNKTPQAQLSLAGTLSAIGEIQSAIRQLNTFLSEPHEQSDLFAGHLALAKVFAKAADWKGVAEHSRKALQLAPSSAEAALLNLQARVQLLAGSASPDAQAWEDIIAALAPLKNAEGSAMQAKLLELQVMIQRGQFDEATKFAAELKKEYPSQYKVAMAEIALLVEQDGQQSKDRALEVLYQIVEDFPAISEPVRYLALMLDRRGDSQKSEAVIKQALERMKEPVSRLELSLLLAQLYEKWGRADDSHALLEELSKEAPDSIPVKRMLLACKAIAGNPEKAQKLVNEMKVVEGEDGRQWRFEQARIWFNADDFSSRSPEIISLLKENLLANPDDQASRVMLAQTYERSGRSETALATYREALSRSPKNVQIVALTVNALFKALEYEEAAEILSRISEEELKRPELRDLQFQNLVRRGELSSAADLLKQSFARDPNNVPTGLSLALLQIQQNEFDEARKLLAELHEKDPNSTQVLVAQVRLHIREGKTDEALRICDQMVEDNKTSSAYIIRAGTYASLEQLDKAEEDFNRAVAADPENASVFAVRSDFYWRTGRKAEATADIEKALALAPDDRSVQTRAVDMFLDAGTQDKTQQAQAILDRALKANPSDSELRLRKARTLVAENTAPAIQDAIQILEELTHDNPEFLEPWRLLATVLMKQGLSAKAIDTILQGLVHNGRDKELLMLKAQAEASKSPFLAIPTLKQLSLLDPNDIIIAFRLADTYIAANEAEKAENLLAEHLAKCDPLYRRVCRTALAVAMYSNNKKTEARAEFDSLIAEEPNDPSPVFAMVKVFEKDKLWDQMESKAIDWYRKHPEDIPTPFAIARILASKEEETPKKIGEDMLRLMFKEHPNDIRIVATLAMLMQARGRNDEAAEFYRKAIEIKPDDVVSVNNLAWIVCENQGKYAEALELAQRGLEIDPKYFDLIDTRGVIYYRMGRFEDAIKDFSKCIEFYPENKPAVTAAYFHLSRALAKTNLAAAIANLKKTLRMNEQVGGLSPDDLAEVNNLLEKLSNKGG